MTDFCTGNTTSQKLFSPIKHPTIKHNSIRLLGLDLDGTLLTKEKEISPYTLDILKSAQEKGVIIVPATGRPIHGIPEELIKILHIRYALTSNGASIYDYKQEKIIYSNPLPKPLVLELLKLLSSFDVVTEVYINGFGYIEQSNFTKHLHDLEGSPIYPYIKKTRKPIQNLIQFVQNQSYPLDKIYISLQNELQKEKISNKLRSYSTIAVTSSIKNSLEINDIYANKGISLLALGRLLGINKEEIMACGDSENDLEMLKAVGLSIAMENADSSIKEVADFITHSNEADGVAYAINTFILK